MPERLLTCQPLPDMVMLVKPVGMTPFTIIELGCVSAADAETLHTCAS